ncbi:hypothetical protein, partial [Microcoleus anatoxicus]
FPQPKRTPPKNPRVLTASTQKRPVTAVLARFKSCLGDGSERRVLQVTPRLQVIWRSERA